MHRVRLARSGRERRDALLQQVEHEEGANRRDVDAANRRHDAAEEVEVDVGDGEDRLQQGDALRLREPREQDADGDEALVEREEVEAALDDDDLWYEEKAKSARTREE